MWRLWHRLFGWHYVAVEYGGSTSIVRVFALPTGRLVCWLMGSLYDLDGCRSLIVPVTGLGQARAVSPLTWRPAAAQPGGVA